MYIKIVSDRKGEHVHERVFAGVDADHLALAGELIFRMGEWQEFGAALLLGAQAMRGRLNVELVGDDAVVAHDRLSPEVALAAPDRLAQLFAAYGGD